MRNLKRRWSAEFGNSAYQNPQMPGGVARGSLVETSTKLPLARAQPKSSLVEVLGPAQEQFRARNHRQKAHTHHFLLSRANNMQRKFDGSFGGCAEEVWWKFAFFRCCRSRQILTISAKPDLPKSAGYRRTRFAHRFADFDK